MTCQYNPEGMQHALALIITWGIVMLVIRLTYGKRR